MSRTVGGREAPYGLFDETANEFVAKKNEEEKEEEEEEMDEEERLCPLKKTITRISDSQEFCQCPPKKRRWKRRGFRKQFKASTSKERKRISPWMRINAHLLKARCVVCKKPILKSSYNCSIEKRVSEEETSFDYNNDDSNENNKTPRRARKRKAREAFPDEENEENEERENLIDLLTDLRPHTPIFSENESNDEAGRCY